MALTSGRPRGKLSTIVAKEVGVEQTWHYLVELSGHEPRGESKGGTGMNEETLHVRDSPSNI